MPKTTYKFADDIEQSSSELVLIERLVAKAYAFYRDPKNEQAFQDWKKARETNKIYCDDSISAGNVKRSHSFSILELPPKK